MMVSPLIELKAVSKKFQLEFSKEYICPCAMVMLSRCWDLRDQESPRAFGSWLDSSTPPRDRR